MLINFRSPGKNYTLQYVEVIQRHHKRTPYASNTFFKEDVAWSCDKAGATFGSTRYVYRGSLFPLKLYLFFIQPKRARLERLACTGKCLYQNFQVHHLTIFIHQWQGYTDAQNPWTKTVGPGFIGSSSISFF